jgi:tRNA G18 (ribose-2'-O)-methylase SpoU
MGHVLTVPWARAAAWPDALGELRAAGFTVAALTPAPSAVPIEHLPAGRIAFVLGTEGAGLDEATMAAADLRVRIPMAAGADSINVAAASAVAFHRVAAIIAE